MKPPDESAPAPPPTGSMPTFLVLGAAKSGTTAYFSFLTSHPELFGSTPKEPNFFAYRNQTMEFQGPGDETVNRNSVVDLDEYRKLFARAGERQRGEASTVYLYHPAAAENIHQLVPSARLVAILRDPVKRAYSAYLHMVRDGREHLGFQDALAAEEERIEASWEPLWHYRRMGFYDEQLSRYLEHFPRRRLKIFLYEEFRNQPARVMAETFRFLGVDDGFRPGVKKRLNVAGKPRSPRLHSILMEQGLIKRTAQRMVPKKVRSQVWAWLKGLNTRQSKPEMPIEVERRLRKEYQPSVRRLETILDRDLAGWR